MRIPTYDDVIKIVGIEYERDARENTVVINHMVFDNFDPEGHAEAQYIAWEWINVNRHTIMLFNLDDPQSKKDFEEDVTGFTKEYLYPIEKVTKIVVDHDVAQKSFADDERLWWEDTVRNGWN